METYNTKIAKDDSLELVLMSGDDDGAALAWAKKHKQPWPIIPNKVVGSFNGGGGKLDLKIDGYPSYFLISSDGEVLARGKEDVYVLAGL